MALMFLSIGFITGVLVAGLGTVLIVAHDRKLRDADWEAHLKRVLKHKEKK